MKKIYIFCFLLFGFGIMSCAIHNQKNTEGSSYPVKNKTSSDDIHKNNLIEVGMAEHPEFKNKDIVISLYRGGFLGGNCYHVNVKNNEILYLPHYCRCGKIIEWEVIKTTEIKIQKFIQQLKSIGIDNWQDRYVDKNIQDGTEWEILIKNKDLNIYIYGSNKYPEKFDEYLKAVRALINNREF